MKEPMNPVLKKILIYVASILTPAVIGVPTSFAFNYWTILEICYLFLGAIELLTFLFRFRSRDRQNFKKNKSIYEDRKNEKFIAFRKEQRTLLILGLINILISGGVGLVIRMMS